MIFDVQYLLCIGIVTKYTYIHYKAKNMITNFVTHSAFIINALE